MNDRTEKLARLRRIIGRCEGTAVAFSGGVDSTLLLRVARDVLGENVLAVTVVSAVESARDVEEAGRIAAELGARWRRLDVDEREIDGFTDNPPDRCYRCKKDLFTRIAAIARGEGLGCVMEASNADDRGDYRPGMRAVAELGIASPLLEAGLSKDDVRALSRELGLEGWNRPSSACLASRIPYGEAITREKLRRIEEAEAFLRSRGFAQCRVRHHGVLARIEVEPDLVARLLEPSLREAALRRLRELGFKYVTVDLQGYRTGSLNEELSRRDSSDGA